MSIPDPQEPPVTDHTPDNGTPYFAEGARQHLDSDQLPAPHSESFIWAGTNIVPDDRSAQPTNSSIPSLNGRTADMHDTRMAESVGEGVGAAPLGRQVVGGGQGRVFREIGRLRDLIVLVLDVALGRLDVLRGTLERLGRRG